MNELRHNPALFQTGGVLGRMDYLINSFKVTGLFILAFIPIGIGAMFGEAGMGLGGLLTAVFALPLVYYGFHNNLKRLRDIRGTTENEVPMAVGMFIALIIPYVSIIASLVLLFAEGAVTGKGTGFGKLEQTISQTVSNVTSARPTETEAERIANLEKFHKLKESGVITEEEFLKYKEEALKKIA